MEGFLLSASTIITPAKIAAYRATHYRVCAAGNVFTLLIGIPSEELGQLYLATGARCALFITAFNPFGKMQSDGENLAAHSRLGEDLRAFTNHIYEGQGADPTGVWPEERSYLALGIDRQIGELLGERAHQDAVVWAGDDGIPQLLCLR
jgi:hypothetical protein